VNGPHLDALFARIAFHKLEIDQCYLATQIVERDFSADHFTIPSASAAEIISSNSFLIRNPFDVFSGSSG